MIKINTYYIISQLADFKYPESQQLCGSYDRAFTVW